MRISDWSSDVCSSDLPRVAGPPAPRPARRAGQRRLARRQPSALGRHLRQVDRGVRGAAAARVDRGGGAQGDVVPGVDPWRSEEHTSELQSLMRISYAVFCLKKKTTKTQTIQSTNITCSKKR